MEHATMSKGYSERRALLEIGGIEVPAGHIKALRWDDVSKDCLPVILEKSTAPRAVICANRMQLDAVRNNNQHVQECFIIEIDRIMKHSNLTYCEDTIELDRKFKHKRRKLMANTKKAIIKDIIQNLNRTRTAAEIGAAHGTSAFNISQMAARLRKQHNFNIPGARGSNEFDIYAAEIAKENPDLLSKPMAPKTTKSNGHQLARMS